MKKAHILPFAVLFALLIPASLAAQNSWGEALGEAMFWEAMRDANRIPYKIENSTGADIQEIYISRTDSSEWGTNQWTNQELFHSGYEVEAKSDDVGPYDIQLVDTGGNFYVKSRVRIVADTVVQFTSRDKVKESLTDKIGNVFNYLFGE